MSMMATSLHAMRGLKHCRQETERNKATRGCNPPPSQGLDPLG